MMWTAVLLVGLGSYLCRVVPLLTTHRLRPGERTQSVLRHAGMGGMAALLVSGLIGHDQASSTLLPALAGVLASTGLALRGRSMTVCLAAGAGLYGGILAVIAVLG
jgi:branched-subunit amino acid transport protein